MDELDKGGLADEVAAEEHAVADFVSIEFLGKFGAREWRGFFDRDFKAEPRAVTATTAGVPSERGGR